MYSQDELFDRKSYSWDNRGLSVFIDLFEDHFQYGDILWQVYEFFKLHPACAISGIKDFISSYETRRKLTISNWKR